jgi:hypothetical protein
MRGGEMTEREPYESPELTEYGTIEEWTQGVRAQIVGISIII